MSVGSSQKNVGTNEESQTSVEDCIISLVNNFPLQSRGVTTELDKKVT